LKRETLVNVLLSSAGRRVSLARAFKRELAELAPGQKLFATDLCPEMSAACQIADRALTVPRISDPAFVDRLLKLCAENEIGLIVPTIDTELLVLSEARPLFEEIGVSVSVPDPSLVEICRDKRLTADLMTAHGIRTPALMAKDALRFPLFAKPYDGSLSKDTFVIGDPSQMTAAQLANEKLIFMEYISPAEHDEYTIDMYYTREHRLACAVPRLRIEVRGGEISKGRTVKGPLLELLRERFATIDGARGCLTAQCFVHRTSGEAIGIEINPRFGGGFPLSYHAGANYPRWLIEERFGAPSRNYCEDWEDGLVMLRYDDEIILHDSSGH
jgi:carbamoyl-phosphate synthase large subunit